MGRQIFGGYRSQSGDGQMIGGMVLKAASFLRRKDSSFVLRYVQTTTRGLMDGSVSTLAPLFATAFATRDPRITFLVGLAAAVGAGISMGFSEGLSDDGSLTGRGSPFLRGTITGLATFVGGILHTLPFLIPHVDLALYVAFGVVGFELLAISFIRYRYFDMSFVVSAVQVCVGGALVFLAGIMIGSA
jgi:VIT1/CCC1 family predicted Fe2+/Mn2+ transporter